MPKGVASDRNRDLTTGGPTSYQALRIHISARSTASILPGRNPAPAPLLAFIPPRAKFLRRSLGFHPISADEFTHHSFVQLSIIDGVAYALYPTLSGLGSFSRKYPFYAVGVQ